MTERLPAASRVSPAPAHLSPVRLDAAAAIAAGRRSHKNPRRPLPETPWERRPRRDAASTTCDGSSHAERIPAEDIIGRGPVSDANAAIAAGRRSHKAPRRPLPETPWERRPRRDAASTTCDGSSHAERIPAEDIIGRGPVSDANAAIAAGRRSHKAPRRPSLPQESAQAVAPDPVGAAPRRDAASTTCDGGSHAEQIPAEDVIGRGPVSDANAAIAAGRRSHRNPRRPLLPQESAQAVAPDPVGAAPPPRCGRTSRAGDGSVRGRQPDTHAGTVGGRCPR